MEGVSKSKGRKDMKVKWCHALVAKAKIVKQCRLNCV